MSSVGFDEVYLNIFLVRVKHSVGFDEVYLNIFLVRVEHGDAIAETKIMMTEMREKFEENTKYKIVVILM